LKSEFSGRLSSSTVNRNGRRDVAGTIPARRNELRIMIDVAVSSYA
jgi:hypothetical protein